MTILNRYAEGWTKGDAAIILESLDDGYELDDPNSGSISKTAFAEYFAAFKGQVEEIRGQTSSPFLEVSEVVTQQEGADLTAWVWWAVPETPIQGSGLIKVGPNGVLSERLAFYTKLPKRKHTQSSMDPATTDKADVTFHCDIGTFVFIAYGRLTIDAAAATDRLTIEGDNRLALEFQRWFPRM